MNGEQFEQINHQTEERLEGEKENVISDKGGFKINWKIVSGVAMLVFVVLAGFFYFKFKPDVGPKYVQAYMLVGDSISESANISITLPPGLDKQTAINSISFDPKMEGEWVESEDESVVIFNPAEKMEKGKYYSVSLATDMGAIAKDFLVDDDPEVISIFPKNDSEASEDSDITIIFNRPMVPLTTLDILENMDIPVVITPETKGKFKWIGTRSLQFIPEDKLIASANYEVKVKSDFVSLDGLKIKDFDHKFSTRALRYEFLSEGSHVYNQPVKLVFNQAVDIDRTSKEISITNQTTGEAVEFVYEYGTKEIYNYRKEKNDTVTNESEIVIFNKNDRHGREGLWDFKNNYNILVKKAYPIEGDIDLNEERSANIQVSDIIQSVEAESDRSNQVATDYFDPAGKIVVNFFEDIDLNRSKIDASRLSKIEYGEKCKQGDGDVYYGSEVECDKEEDKKTLYLYFDKDKIDYSDVVVINFEKIVNLDKLQLNKETINYTIKAIPKFRITNVLPGTEQEGVSLTEISVCSSNPLLVPDDEDVNDYLKVNPEYNFENWGYSYRIREDMQNVKCAVGEFETRINYKLLPGRDYKIDLSLVDHFDQSATYTKEFKSGKMPNQYLNFYHMQNTYNVSTPDKTKLTYATENMEFIDYHICKLSAEGLLRYLHNRPRSYVPPSNIGDCIEIKEGRIDLENKYWIRNYFQLNLNDYFENTKGHYIVTFSNPKYKENNGQGRPVYERTYFSVTDLSIVEKKVKISNSENSIYNIGESDIKKLENLYWVTNLKTLEPISNAQVDRYYYSDDNIIKEGQSTTDSKGIARSNPIDKMAGLVVTKDGDSALVYDQINEMEYTPSSASRNKIYMYTDRPIYRPGHEVFIKGIYRSGYDGAYETNQGKKINLTILNSDYKEIHREELEVNEYGTFNASFVIDAQAPLGTYSVRVNDHLGYASFEVEEYVPAAFRVDASIDKEEYASKDNVKISVDASYYFGAPLEGGKLEYTINSQDYHFDKYQDEYFKFGSGWYYCYWDCDYGDKFVLRNSLDLDARGKAEINHVLDINKLFADEDNKTSKIFTVDMIVTNSSGQQISSKKSFVVHAGEYYLGIKTNKYFTAKNEDFQVKIKSVSKEGFETEVKDIDLSINKVEWVRNKRKEVDGAFYYRWEKKLNPVKNEVVDTDKKGDWTGSFNLSEEGEYEIIVEGTDNAGNKIKSNYNMYVWGEAFVDVRPSNDTSLEIVANKTSLASGEEAEIIIKSPYEKAKALISIERGQIFDYEIVDVSGGLFSYKFDIKEEYIPNVYATVTLLSPDPEIKYGKVHFNIDLKDKVLNIEVTPNKTHYLPGDEVELNYKVSDSNGQPVEAELSTAVVDLSVLALKGNPKKNPVVFFYDGFSLTVTTVSNVKNILYEIEIRDGTKGGGGSSEDLATKKRGEFEDTAFWQAIIKTDKKGEAKIKFTLPDNLTTWQVESVGVTKDTKLGVAYAEFMARKDVMVVPLKPRFVIPGDEFMIGAKVFNQTNETQKLDISVSSDSLTLVGDVNDGIKLDANESDTIYFKAVAPSSMRDGWHDFTLSAKNDEYEDTVENTIKINRNNTYETTATAGSSKETEVKEFVFVPGIVDKDRGELTINHSATLAVFLSEAIDYLFTYPYGCSEQIASKLNGIAIAQKGLNLENIGDDQKKKMIDFDGKEYTVEDAVKMSLARIYENQKADGGFGYYSNMLSDVYLTIHVLQSLDNLRDAGLNVDEQSISRATNYINSKIKNDKYLKDNLDLIILASFTMAEVNPNLEIDSYYINMIKSKEKDDQYLNEKGSYASLIYLAMLTTEKEKVFGKNYKDKVFDILENKIEIDARGAFMPLGANYMWDYYETPTKNTALFLKAMVKDERDSAVMDRALRWLLRSRDKDGAWGSTNNTITVIDAMTDYLTWKKENESSFSLKVLINDQEKNTFTYGPENILEQNIFVTPISELNFDKINPVSFQKNNLNKLDNNFYYDMSLKYYLPIDSIPPRDEGFTVTRSFYELEDEYYDNPVAEAEVGDVFRGHIEVVVPKERNFVAIEDFIPAGVELINFNLDTENMDVINSDSNSNDMGFQGYNDYYYGYSVNEKTGNQLIFSQREEMRDDRVFLFVERMSPGTYEYDYYVRVLVPGKFHHLPAIASEMYTPENFGRTRGDWFVVKE